MQKSVIIVAAGRGKRMGTETPKQFLLLKSKPILMHTITCFYKYDPSIEIVVVLSEEHISKWQQLCIHYNFNIKHTIVEGGEERFYSVKNGLEVINHNGIVAIHDGVRPLVSNETIIRCFNKALETDAAIPVMPVVESLRRLEGEKSFSVNRTEYVTVQTPQCFNIDLIKKAYQQKFSNTFTDDASVLEKLGHSISLVEGNIENIKITSPLDLILAEKLLEQTER
jgi:2-C-methyl-D-erythritol 4-phosphate cytidylyltransferase